MIPHFKQSVTVIPVRQLHCMVPTQVTIDGSDALAVGNFSADLSPALRGYYVELRI